MEQALYRAAKAAFALELLPEAASYCRRGLELSPSNDELKKLSAQIDLKKREDENHKAEVSKALAEAKVCYLVRQNYFRIYGFFFFSNYNIGVVV